MKKITGAEIVVDILKNHGVKDVFLYPGGTFAPMLDVIYTSKSINMIVVRHEQGAVHAADGYARITGAAGVCMAISGPGATNLVTGIANAYLDSIPMVAFTGQVERYIRLKKRPSYAANGVSRSGY